MSILVIAHPRPDGSLHFVQMFGGQAHLQAIGETIRWLPAESEAPTLEPLPEPFSLNLASGMDLDMYPIGMSGEKFPLPEGFRPIPAAALEKRQAWREDLPERLAVANQKLAPFGYQLQGESLYRAGQPVLERIRPVGRVSVNASGTDFVLVVRDDQENDLTIRNGEVETHHGWLTAPPVFVGDDLVTLSMSPDWQVTVEQAGQVVFEDTAPPSMSGGVHGLWSWDGHWVAELEGNVLVDGVPLNEALGYEETFGWRLIDNRPFYFFKKDGKIGLSYAGEVLSLQVDEVIHYACCSGAVWDIEGNDTMVSFFATQDGVSYYVEAGVFQ